MVECPWIRPHFGVGVLEGGTLGTVPFSSTSSGALLLTEKGSASSWHRQQKRDWRMLRPRGFLAAAGGLWAPAGLGSTTGVGHHQDPTIAALC